MRDLGALPLLSLRLTAVLLAAVLLGLALAAPLARAAAPAPPPGEAEFRAAWIAFSAPSADPEKARSLEARQQARMAAIPKMEEAVSADPKNPLYYESLAYICLTAGQYEKGRKAVDQGIALKRDRPLLYLLRGQAEAARAQMNPRTARDNIGPALSAFDQAGRLDPQNSLPLLQAASVAFDVGRPDLALPRVEQALQRPTCRLYRLALPENLDPDRGASFRMWQYAQLGAWMELLARCRNAHSSLLRLGEKAEEENDLPGAEARFQQALAVGRHAGQAEPNLFITVATALDLLEDAYGALGRVAEARGDPQAERWQGEAGVIRVARGQLAGALQGYIKEISGSPPPSLDQLLALEGRHVAPVIRGMGLQPQPSQAGVGEERPAVTLAPALPQQQPAPGAP